MCYTNIYINIIVYQKYTGTSIKYEKRLLLRCIHHFKSDLINNMNHMHNWGTISSDPKPKKVVQELNVMPQLKKAVLCAQGSTLDTHGKTEEGKTTRHI